MDTEDRRESEDRPSDDGMLPLDDEEEGQEDETQTPGLEYVEHETHPVDDEADEPVAPVVSVAPPAQAPGADRAFRGFLLLAIVVIVALAILAVAWNFHLIWHGEFFPAVIPKEERGLGSTFYRLSTIQQRIEVNPQAAYGYPKGIVVFLRESGLIKDVPTSRPAGDAAGENRPDALDSESE